MPIHSTSGESYDTAMDYQLDNPREKDQSRIEPGPSGTILPHGEQILGIEPDKQPSQRVQEGFKDLQHAYDSGLFHPVPMNEIKTYQMPPIKSVAGDDLETEHHVDHTTDVPKLAGSLGKGDKQHYGMALSRDVNPNITFKRDDGTSFTYNGIPGLITHENAETAALDKLVEKHGALGKDKEIAEGDAYKESHNDIAIPTENNFMGRVAALFKADKDRFLSEYNQHWQDQVQLASARMQNVHKDLEERPYNLKEKGMPDQAQLAAAKGHAMEADRAGLTKMVQDIQKKDPMDPRNMSPKTLDLFREDAKKDLTEKLYQAQGLDYHRQDKPSNKKYNLPFFRDQPTPETKGRQQMSPHENAEGVLAPTMESMEYLSHHAGGEDVNMSDAEYLFRESLKRSIRNDLGTGI